MSPTPWGGRRRIALQKLLVGRVTSPRSRSKTVNPSTSEAQLPLGKICPRPRRTLTLPTEFDPVVN